MKKIAVFLMMLLFCTSLYPIQDQPKKYDLQFALSGGNIGGKFNLAGDVLWVQEFKNGLFAQGSGFVLGKEYGASLGFGLSGQNLGIYLFGDSLYHQKMFFQLRPAVRLTFPWLSLTAFYALPITKSTIQVGDEKIGAVQYWGGEVNMVPMSWARVYGNLSSIGKICTYRIGAEVRPLKWLSISADWNRTDSGLYSKWSGYEDLRVALNFSLNSKFKLNQKIQMQPMYPILSHVKTNSDNKPPEIREYRDIVIAVYTRDPAKIVFPKGDDKGVFMPYELSDPGATSPLNEDDRQVINGIRYGVAPLVKTAENIYSATLRHVLIDKNAAFYRHAIYVCDAKIGANYDSPNPYGITVEEEYDTTVLYSKYWFRIR